MKYMGSKNRHAKELLPIILANRKKDQWYIEPFVGGCNMIDKVKGNRMGNDIHFFLIQLFKAIQNGWIPPDTISENKYNSIKNSPALYDPELVGFVGFGCSYSGKWFGGYARGNDNNGNPRNYCLESKNNILNQSNNLRDVIFTNLKYWEMHIPPNSIIYCDPPYQGTTKYKDNFNHDIFWNWVRNNARNGHTVFVSEYSAPSDFECVWSKKVNNTLTKDTGSKQGVEKLFVFKETLLKEELF